MLQRRAPATALPAMLPKEAGDTCFVRLNGARGEPCVRIRFGDVIPAGMPRKEIEAEVHNAINALND